jgi:hypothetical protein
MKGIDDRNLPFDGRDMPETAPHGFWHVAAQVLFGTIGITLITFAVDFWLPFPTVPSLGIGPGTISLVYLIVIVFVSRSRERGGRGQTFSQSASDGDRH